MCDLYPPPSTEPAPLDDFQVFKKWTLPYSNYYSTATYDQYVEPEVESATTVYHDLVNAKEYPFKDDYKCKYIVEWTEEDTLSWVLDTVQLNEYEVPLYVFRIPGIALRGMKKEEIVQLMSRHHNVDQIVVKRIADVVFQNLQYRLNDENSREAVVPVSVYRYVQGDPYQQQDPETLLNLDEQKSRLFANDYRPDDRILLQASDSSDDTEDVFRSSETASPDYSDVSKSSDDDEKKREFKRPPGRPKGSGRKISKRVKSVSVPVFLRNLLLDPTYCPSIIKWEDYSQGKFRFLKPDEVAKIWGKMKQNDHMTFEKFSRAMRYHYRQGVLVSVPTARLVYQFGRNGPDYSTDNPNFSNVKSEHEIHESRYS